MNRIAQIVLQVRCFFFRRDVVAEGKPTSEGEGAGFDDSPEDEGTEGTESSGCARREKKAFAVSEIEESAKGKIVSWNMTCREMEMPLVSRSRSL